MNMFLIPVVPDVIPPIFPETLQATVVGANHKNYNRASTLSFPMNISTKHATSWWKPASPPASWGSFAVSIGLNPSMGFPLRASTSWTKAP